VPSGEKGRKGDLEGGERHGGSGSVPGQLPFRVLESSLGLSH
jgi:hypothetical protein